MRSSRWLATPWILSLSACATVIHGTKQTVPIVSRPAGAEVTVDGTPVGQTPVVAHLRRRSGQLIRIELTGFQPFQLQLKRRVSPAVWWDVLFLYYVVPLPIDLGTGGLYEIKPDVVAVPLRATETAAIANDSGNLAFGTRVRLKIAGTGTVKGAFLEQDADSITTWPSRASAPLAVSLGSVIQLDTVSQRHHGHAALGAAIGGGVGAVAGVGFVALLNALNLAFGERGARPSDYWIGAASFAAGGALEGALIGSLFRGESWEPVRPRRAALQPLLGKREVGLAVRLRH